MCIKVEQEKKCSCSKYLSSLFLDDISCAGQDLYVCRGSDGHLHRINAENDKCSIFASKAESICVKKGQSFSGSESEINEEIALSTAAVDVSPKCGCQDQVLIFKDIKCLGKDKYSCLMDNGKIL